MLKQMQLFRNATDDDIRHVLQCLETFEKNLDKNQIIYDYFNQITYAGIVLTGEVHAVMHNTDGVEYDVRRFGPGDLFGEAFSCIPTERSTIQIVTRQPSRILFLKFSNLFTAKAFSCKHASKISANLLQECARNNIFQNQKIQLFTQKHLRDRLTTYLWSLPQSGANQVIVPFDRQGMANYLGVERSALSRELGRMKKDGMIDYHKNMFTLIRCF